MVEKSKAAARIAVDKAGQWLTELALASLDHLDTQGLALILFGLGCAIRLSDQPEQRGERLRASERLLEKLLARWEDPKTGSRAQFESGAFLTTMMSAASLHAETELASTFREVCQREWLVIEHRQILTSEPSLLWAGKHLARALVRDPHTKHEIPRWTSQVSLQVPKYAASAYEIQQISRDLAALSAFGQFPPQLNNREKDYLRDALPFWTFFYVKERDLDIVCPLVRAMNYMRLSSYPEYLDGIIFILQQTKHDGRFGMQEMAIHLRSLQGDNADDSERNIYLPLTVSCVWTLLECVFPSHSPFLIPIAAAIESDPGQFVAPAEYQKLQVNHREAIPGESFSDFAEVVKAKALSWVQERLDLFSPLSYDNVRRLQMALKASSELALVCGLACRRGDSTGSTTYRDIASHLWHQVFSNEAIQEYLLDNPATLPSFSIYASLYQCGYEDSTYRSRLEALLEEGYVAAVENIASVQMDLIYNLATTGLPLGGASFAETYKRTLLAKLPSLYRLTNADVYTITHTIFFLTDFGLVKPSSFSAKEQQYSQTTLPRLLEFYMRRGNWDLVAELLITLRALSADDAPVFNLGWSLLLSAQNEDGSFDGPVKEERAELNLGVGDVEESDARNEGDYEWILFRDNYHTTLAVLLAIETAGVAVVRSNSLR